MGSVGFALGGFNPSTPVFASHCSLITIYTSRMSLIDGLEKILTLLEITLLELNFSAFLNYNSRKSIKVKKVQRTIEMDRSRSKIVQLFEKNLPTPPRAKLFPRAKIAHRSILVVIRIGWVFMEFQWVWWMTCALSSSYTCDAIPIAPNHVLHLIGRRMAGTVRNSTIPL